MHSPVCGCERCRFWDEIDRLRDELKAHGIDPDRCDELGEHVRKNMCPEPTGWESLVEGWK